MASAGVRLRRERADGPRMSAETFLGLGSNMGDRLRYLELAVKVLRGVDPDLTVSPVYETAPLGGPESQSRYLNCVVRLETDLTARQLLEVAHGLEELAGRVRTVRNGPRTLDIDILFVGDLRDLRARPRGAAPEDVRARLRAGAARGPRRVTRSGELACPAGRNGPGVSRPAPGW